MVLKRNPKEYYFLSTQGDLDGAMLSPYLPKPQELPSEIDVDRKIKRIPIYTSVTGGLAARRATKGEIFTVYKVTGIYPSNIETPSAIQNPLASMLGEKWALAGIQLRKIGDVEAGRVKKTETIKVGKFQREKKLELPYWKDLRPEWEQKKIPLH